MRLRSQEAITMLRAILATSLAVRLSGLALADGTVRVKNLRALAVVYRGAEGAPVKAGR
jgi:hypothetical protein